MDIHKGKLQIYIVIFWLRFTNFIHYPRTKISSKIQSFPFSQQRPQAAALSNKWGILTCLGNQPWSLYHSLTDLFPQCSHRNTSAPSKKTKTNLSIPHSFLALVSKQHKLHISQKNNPYPGLFWHLQTQRPSRSFPCFSLSAKRIKGSFQMWPRTALKRNTSLKKTEGNVPVCCLLVID